MRNSESNLMTIRMAVPLPDGNEKVIIDSISGAVQPGQAFLCPHLPRTMHRAYSNPHHPSQVLAIMGPSGAGKVPEP